MGVSIAVISSLPIRMEDVLAMKEGEDELVWKAETAIEVEYKSAKESFMMLKDFVV